MSLEVSTVSAAPGTEVTIEVMLHTDGVEVAGIQNDLSFDRATAITSCRVNPDIDKKASGFALHPRGCKAGGDCERLRALIVSLENSKPIADGAVLYQCVVKVAADAAPRSYALTTSAVFASDPTGAAPAAKGVDGKVIVESKG